MLTFRIKRNKIGLVATLGRRIFLLPVPLFEFFVNLLEEENLVEEAINRYVKETSKRFRILYKVMSLEALIRIGGKMAEDMGWFKIKNIKKVRNVVEVEIVNTLHPKGKKCFVFLVNIALKLATNLTKYKLSSIKKIDHQKYIVQLVMKDEENNNTS